MQKKTCRINHSDFIFLSHIYIQINVKGNQRYLIESSIALSVSLTVVLQRSLTISNPWF